MSPARRRQAGFDREVDAVLDASRALVGIAARSLAGLSNELTLPQFRALVLVGLRDRRAMGELADALGIHPSSATRLVDRLVAKGLIIRQESAGDRRQTRIELSASGRDLLERVNHARRGEIASILEQVSPQDRRAIGYAFTAFAIAAGEVSEDSWALGWTEDRAEGPRPGS